MLENPSRRAARLAHEAEIRALLRTCSPGNVGAASELLVCVDLLRKGWHVFRAVSAQSPCDLIALKGVCKLEIEVRTSSGAKKKLSAPTHGKHDILALVKDFQIEYHPSLPTIELETVETL